MVDALDVSDCKTTALVELNRGAVLPLGNDLGSAAFVVDHVVERGMDEVAR